MSKKVCISNEYLVEEYVNKKLSVKEIAKNLDVCVATIYNKFREFGIEKRKNSPNLIDKEFDKWTVIAYDRYDGHHAKWICRCQCGYEKSIHAFSLLRGVKKGGTTQCKKCCDKAKTSTEEFRQSFVTKIRLCAKRRNIRFGLTKRYLYNLYLEQDRRCAITGEQIGFPTTNRGMCNGEGTASLDRIDSSKPYVKGNVQWIHKDINKLKMDLSEQELIERCKRVVYGPKCTNVVERK